MSQQQISPWVASDGRYFRQEADCAAYQRELNAKAERYAARVAAYVERIRKDPDGWAESFLLLGQFKSVDEAAKVAEQELARALRRTLTVPEVAKLGMTLGMKWNALYPLRGASIRQRFEEYEARRRAALLAATIGSGEAA